jgi:hypothetical protein
MKDLQVRSELVRAGHAAVFGWLGTSVMTLLMAICLIPGMPAAFRPFPVEFVRHVFPRLGPLALTLLTVPLHFGYGAAAGALFSFLARPMSLGRGFAVGFALWVVMQILFVPIGYGWLEFGLGGGHPWAALVSLVLHLCYGGTLGFLGGRDDLLHHTQFDEADRVRVA